MSLGIRKGCMVEPEKTKIRGVPLDVPRHGKSLLVSPKSFKVSHWLSQLRVIDSRINRFNSVYWYVHFCCCYLSGDSWMYPYQRTPMGNPYISPI